MPSFAMTVPYLRTTPIHIPRRDLVLAAADSLRLRVLIVEADTPTAPGIDVTGGIGGPAAQFAVWPDVAGHYWDYGTAFPHCGRLLWSGDGVAVSGISGAFDFSFSSGTLSRWPRRCRWSVQLNDTLGAEVLMTGRLHIAQYGVAAQGVAPHLLTDTYEPVHTDTEEHVLA
jgi:hypothetical protein